jgi:mannose-6-phosphate isomerase
MDAMTVFSLPANQPETFYRGAGRIAAFRSGPALPDRPEDWVASTTTRFGLAPSGLSALPDGRLLADAVAADPAWWLGPGRTDTGILVKLLDAGQRLPLHVHPDRRFAHQHLASPYGKTEAWVIVSAEPDAYVHLGFARDVAPEELAAWVAGQQTEEMLAATNRVPVRAGDAVLCPAGLPHAIGPGIFLVEIQEPTDFSVLLEYAAFGLDGGHLELGWDLALQCVDRSAWSPQQLAALRGDDTRLLPAEADPFFAATRLRGPVAALDAAFSVVVVVSGAGTLAGEHDRLVVRRGDTLLIPYAAGRLTLAGDLEAVRLSPARAG